MSGLSFTNDSGTGFFRVTEEQMKADRGWLDERFRTESGDRVMSVYNGQVRHEMKFMPKSPGVVGGPLWYGDGNPMNDEPCVNLQDRGRGLPWEESGEPCGHLPFEHYEEHAPAMFNNLPCGVKGCTCDNYWSKADRTTEG